MVLKDNRRRWDHGGGGGGGGGAGRASPGNEFWEGPTGKLLHHAWLAILAILTHAVVGVVALSTFHALERFVQWLHNGHEPLVFGVVKVSEILEGGDATLLVGIVIVGIIQAVRILWRA